jgi:regulation of enolase protein 1 (concanavalin A-like superfamily)
MTDGVVTEHTPSVILPLLPRIPHPTMSQSQFKFANSDAKVPGNGTLPPEFIIKAPASTDIWAKPPSTIRFSAPILYKSVPLKSFKRIRVAFNALWEKKYDQGGVILVLNTADGGQKWVKSGIELTHGRPHLSVVAKDNWADWSLIPVPSGGGAATLELVKETDNSLWIYLVEGLQKSPIREVTWVFDEENVKDFWVGVYAARPSSEGKDFSVNFGHLIIDQE